MNCRWIDDLDDGEGVDVFGHQLPKGVLDGNVPSGKLDPLTHLVRRG